MPTTYKRIQVTDDPRVQRILDIGSARWPQRRPGAVLVSLAEERAEQLAAGGEPGRADPVASLITVRGPAITTETVAEILADED